MVIWQLFLFPALSLFQGLSPAHEQICCELGKSSILVPISAIIAEAAVTSIPGIEHNKASGAGNGTRTRDIQLGKLTLYH